jgi:regulator of sigma E protease
MTILATIVVLGVLIFVHELGHFWAARSVGVRVERFSIGLGPRVYGFRKGETEYVISAIPLGGYVKMAGMDDEVMEAIEGGAPRGEEGDPDAAVLADAAGPAAEPVERDRSGDYDSKPVWARAWVISAGVIMNFLFAFLAYTAVAAGWGSAELDTRVLGDVRTEHLPPGTEALGDVPPGSELVGIGPRTPAHWGEIRDAILDLPAGPIEIRFVRPDGAEASVEARLPDAAEERRRLYLAMEYWTDPVIVEVTPGSPGARAGFARGDRIVAIEGQAVERWAPFTRTVQERPDLSTSVTIERDGQRETLDVVPERIEAADAITGEMRTIGRIGISHGPHGIAWSRLGVVESVQFGASQTWALTAFIVDFLGQLVTGRASPRNLGSIVTIGEASGQAAAEGLPVFLSFMALLSINLAILNLLPIPVLDGGHLVFLALEAIRGRPVSVEQRMRWSQVGFFILIGIMVLALGNDFMRLFGL